MVTLLNFKRKRFMNRSVAMARRNMDVYKDRFFN